MKQHLELRIGPPATGPNFYKRPVLIERLMRAIQRGNVAFLGPRRTGKTSCLEEIKANPGEYLPILINLEKFNSVEIWFSEMITQLSKIVEKPPQRFSWAKEKCLQFLARIKEIKIPAVGSVSLNESKQAIPWRKAADEFLKLLVNEDIPALFLLDEFPTFLQLVAKKSSKEEVESVLHWFRAARHDLQDCRARFLVTGSIGLSGVVRRLDLAPAVNEFDILEIPPLTDAEALGLLEILTKNDSLPLDARAHRHILKLLGANWPFLLQLFISEIQEQRFDNKPSLKQLDNIYRDQLVHGNRNQYCDGMHHRLKNAFTPSEYQLAREILRTVCRKPEGLTHTDFEDIHARMVPDPNHRVLVADELDCVLDTLKHDGYLLQDKEGDHRTRFASNILRDYWLVKTS
jgi:hypothetical protein